MTKILLSPLYTRNSRAFETCIREILRCELGVLVYVAEDQAIFDIDRADYRRVADIAMVYDCEMREAAE